MRPFASFVVLCVLLWAPRGQAKQQNCGTKFANFKCDLEQCSSRCLARANCVSRCMKSKGYDCEDCYGTVAQCTAGSCWRQCFRGCNENCAACSARKCSPALADCLGVRLSKIPLGCCEEEEDEESKQKVRAFWRRIDLRKHEVMG